eukprot:1383002-Rhodomonas_salina.1
MMRGRGCVPSPRAGMEGLEAGDGGSPRIALDGNGRPGVGAPSSCITVLYLERSTGNREFLSQPPGLSHPPILFASLRVCLGSPQAQGSGPPRHDTRCRRQPVTVGEQRHSVQNW